MDGQTKITETGNPAPVSSGNMATAEDAAAIAFSKQAPVFDTLYGTDTVIQYKRQRVRAHMEQFLQPGSYILELNAGTGEDAIYFAGKGHHVHATDIAAGMQEQLISKIKTRQLEQLISYEQCSFTNLESLRQQGPYDHIFSNFAGLNCTNRLDKVLSAFNALLKPGGYATLVILPKFCTWEFLMLFSGKFRTAFRRFAGSKGAKARLEGKDFRCWYYNPSYVRKQLKENFTLVQLEGLCTLVPPGYIENFAIKRPKLFRWLVHKENKWKQRWPWKVTGDYYIITLRKR
jgi:ubiquinone/menaquinone biosynthesis C-methylase UbiE